MSLSPEVIRELKREWLSELPSSWRFARFGDVLHMKRRPIEVEDHVEYVQPVIRRGHGGIEIRERQLGALIKTKAQFVVHAGDWLMSKVQILHRAYGLVPVELDKAIASGSYYAFEIQKDLDPTYLWYLSHANVFHKSCELASVGVVVEKMVFRATDWLEFEFPLPPLDEQRRIAEILSSVDEAIAATRVVIEQTRKVKQGVLERLLTQGIGHTRFKQTEIGEIPEGWEAGRIGDFFTLQRGFDITEKQSTAGEYPVVSSSGISYYHSEAMVPGPAVITGRKGKLGQVHFINSSCWPHDTTLWVKDFKGNEPKFVYWFLRSLNLEKFDAATAVPTLNRNVVHGLSCAFPPTAEQSRIADRLDSIEAAEHLQTRNLAAYVQMKAALMSDLLTGRKRITDALPIAAE